ncbi:uncharacterized protein HMPREF1541_08586 [Cyphellophora europaea CBS 101466]|uniref:tRNA (guanine(10)-N(2))-methyltransferase n=1 Tax=Cyphellophora europaea (strain CBS 101466) TaxID=1220924 RepID=W2RKP8_CYPE1|nr:uncharacterized protein HMPREF1541_08586 [Cyphellophora europaea CBS 101466]ETN36309.1 hypothetical protein HMPREF1541_08586 [Cyphellophora europaea CBS 101466]
MDNPHLYLIRFTQTHIDFRLAELEALETLLNRNLPLSLRQRRQRVKVHVVRYEVGSPFCVVRFTLVGRRERAGGGAGGGGENGLQNARAEDDESEVRCDDEVLLGDVARRFIARSVQAKGIYELWGHADDAGFGEDATRPVSIEASKTHGSEQREALRPETTAAKPEASFTDIGEPAVDNHNSTVMPPLYAALHASTHTYSAHRWSRYRSNPGLKFKFSVDSFNHARSAPEQVEIINSFAYLDFDGLVRMKDAAEEWVVFEDWAGPPSALLSRVSTPASFAADLKISNQSDAHENIPDAAPAPSTSTNGRYPNTYRSLARLYFARAVSTTTLRPLIEVHDLKKRPYISTTSMDTELALVTANLALASTGKMFLDPFCGTGGFLVAAAELGAWVLGSDIDGRSFKGKGGAGLEKGVGRNFAKYKLHSRLGGCLTGDLVNTPLIRGGEAYGKGRRWLDGIIADPPYGVREGLKVLGARKPATPLGGEDESMERKPYLIDGVPAYLLPGYVAPKRPYSFDKMLDDVLEFAVATLVDSGRLAFWMPSANENERGEEEETRIPTHPGLALKHVCVQRFNRWSRRLLVYERKLGVIEDAGNGVVAAAASALSLDAGGRADDLNSFRRRYFQGFAVDSEPGGND